MGCIRTKEVRQTEEGEVDDPQMKKKAKSSERAKEKTISASKKKDLAFRKRERASSSEKYRALEGEG